MDVTWTNHGCPSKNISKEIITAQNNSTPVGTVCLFLKKVKMTRKTVRLFLFLLFSQILIEPLSCQLVTRGAFFTVMGARKPYSSQEDEMTLQQELFNCGVNAKCRNVVISATTDEKSDETEVTNADKVTTNQKGINWIKVPEPADVISRGKDTKQSTTYSTGVSSLAVDGSRNSMFLEGSCSHTNVHEGDTLPWWRVDIGHRAIVYNVIITNRGDCCPERLRDFTIRVGFEDQKNVNPACRENVGITTGITVDFKCDRALAGQFVYIESAYENLTLCEVEVYGYYF